MADVLEVDRPTFRRWRSAAGALTWHIRQPSGRWHALAVSVELLRYGHEPRRHIAAAIRTIRRG